MALTLDGSQAGQHRWAGLRTGAAAEQTPPPVVGGRCLNCDLVLKILKTHINLKCRVVLNRDHLKLLCKAVWSNYQ